MRPINPVKSGLAIGVLFGLWHLLWAICVAIGLAQWLINSVFWLHFLSSPFTVVTFQWSTACFLILVTAAIGFLFGFVFALLWNWLHRAEPA